MLCATQCVFVNMASPYFEGAESIAELGFFHFQRPKVPDHVPSRGQNMYILGGFDLEPSPFDSPLQGFPNMYYIHPPCLSLRRLPGAARAHMC